MEQVGTMEQPVPIEIVPTGKREAAAFAVVDDRRRPEPRSGREKVETHASGRALYAVRVDPISSQIADGSVSKGIVRHAADHRCLMPETRKAHRDICLRAADMDIEPPTLQQQLTTGCGQPQ